uniref:Uncharacterized protein n=1 Tax=Solanum tuberosum TaxID=4113 RepID=M1DRE8_SOLTU
MASPSEDGDVFVDDVTVEEQRRLELEQLEMIMTKILMEKDGCERRKTAPLIAMRNELMLVKKEEIKELERERKILEELRERIKIRKEAAALKQIIDVSLFFLVLFLSFFSFLLVSTQVK